MVSKPLHTDRAFPGRNPPVNQRADTMEAGASLPRSTAQNNRHPVIRIASCAVAFLFNLILMFFPSFSFHF